MIGIDLSGRVVVVTGSSAGIGAGIARRFAAAGASVVTHHRGGPPPDIDGPSIAVRADLTDPDGPQRVVDAAVDHYGRLDAVVNNAGIQPVADLVDVDESAMAEMLAVNVTATHRVTRSAAAHMAGSGGGSIVHIASIEGHQPAPMHGHYATSKAAVLMHARAAASEWGPLGIRVNSVSPGLIGRPGIEEAWPEGVARWRAAAPLGRLGTPEDVGDACVFLCSPLARWITGADLVVDGGVSNRSTW